MFELLFQTIKQNNKEHYRRLLEMVTEKYSKNQPLPFNQTKPKEWVQIHSQFLKYCRISLSPTYSAFLCSFALSELLPQSGPRTAASRNPFESVPIKMGVTGKSHWSDYFWVTICYGSFSFISGIVLIDFLVEKKQLLESVIESAVFWMTNEHFLFFSPQLLPVYLHGKMHKQTRKGWCVIVGALVSLDYFTQVSAFHLQAG